MSDACVVVKSTYKRCLAERQAFMVVAQDGLVDMNYDDTSSKQDLVPRYTL